MPIATSQYWNQVHGNTAEEVVQDLEGMQTMRTLGKNIAWMLKCRQAAQRAGVQAPEYEPQIITNFIRSDGILVVLIIQYIIKWIGFAPLHLGCRVGGAFFPPRWGVRPLRGR